MTNQVINLGVQIMTAIFEHCCICNETEHNDHWWD